MLIESKFLRKIIRESLLKEQGFYSKMNIAPDGNGSGGGGESVGNEKYDISQLSFTQIDVLEAGKAAEELHAQIGIRGLNETDNGKEIVELVHMPLYDAIKGPGAMKRDKRGDESLFDYYSKNLSTNHWSSWFLNRCYMNSAAWDYIEAIARGFEHPGCCYPYANIASNNRPKVFNNPESMKGKTMLMLFSKKEIDDSPDLSLKPGVASIVGQGGGDPDWENIRTSTQLVSGEKHMNIMASDSKWIGGNLSGTTGVKNDINKGGYMLLVKFNGLKENKDTKAVSGTKTSNNSKNST